MEGFIKNGKALGLEGETLTILLKQKKQIELRERKRNRKKDQRGKKGGRQRSWHLRRRMRQKD